MNLFHMFFSNLVTEIWVMFVLGSSISIQVSKKVCGIINKWERTQINIGGVGKKKLTSVEMLIWHLRAIETQAHTKLFKLFRNSSIETKDEIKTVTNLLKLKLYKN